MSAPWRCEVCNGGDGEDRHPVCDCITILRSQWDLLRTLWMLVRSGNADVAVLDYGSVLDEIFFKGETVGDRSSATELHGSGSCGSSCEEAKG